MKKLLLMLLSVALVLSLFAGCTPKTDTPAADPAPEAGTDSGSTTPAEGDVVIKWGMFETDNLTAEMYATIIDAFEAANPGIKIEKVLAAGDSRPAFWKTLIASGNLPDVIMEAELLATTEGLFAEVPQDVQALVDPAMLCTYNGKCVTVPYMKQLRMQCYYNKADFAALGVEEPKNYEDFLAACETLKNGGKVPMICGGSGDIWATGLWWTAATNQSVMESYPNFNEELKNGTRGWDDPVIEESLKTWQDLVNKGYYHKGCMSYSYSQAATEFQNGAASMMIDGSWAAAGFDAAGNEDFGVFSFPSPEGLKTYCTAPCYFGVSEKSENKEAAFTFIKYLLSTPDIYGTFLKADGWSSATKEPVTYEQGPVMNKFVENLSDYTLVPEIVKVTGDYAIPAGFQDEVDKMMQNVFVGKDVASELKALQSQYEIAKEQ